MSQQSNLRSQPRVSLEQWRALQAVVEHGGFAQAADYLHRSQSSVSYTVGKLQQQLGIALLQMQGRKAVLTEAGKSLLRRSQHLLQEALELEQFADSLSQGWEAEIQLVVDAAFPTDLLMRALHQFEPLSQGTRVRLNEVILSGACEALEQGDADLAITAHIPSDRLGDPLIKFDFIAVAHAHHGLHQLGREITHADLQTELQVIIHDSGISRQQDVGWLGAEHQWSVSSIDTAVTAVCEGLGYAWLPKHRIGELLKSKTLTPLSLREGSTYEATLYLVYGQAREPGTGTRLLADLLRATVKAGAEAFSNKPAS